MKRTIAAVAALTAVASAATGAAVAVALVSPAPGWGTAYLSGRAILPGDTVRAGSPASGAFLSAGDRTNARNNGVTAPDAGAVFANQPVQGISGVIASTTPGQYWALSDNGYGARGNSADWQLRVNKVQPAFATGAAAPGGVTITGGFTLSDPWRKVPWRIVCDPARGDALPPFDFNVLPATTPSACDGGTRILTGFDFDTESMQIGADGTFWFGEEFGPFLLHTDAQGRLLEAPIATPGVRSPQNPRLDVAAGERPNLNSSKGFEGMGISPDRRTLYPLLEGPVVADNNQDLRIYRFDIARRRWEGFNRYRLELQGPKVNTATLKLADGTLAYPGDVAPAAPIGNQAIGELTFVNDDTAVIIERDGGGDNSLPRFKKLFTVELPSRADGRLVGKKPLVDLMAIPDPERTGADGDFFRFPFNTIESVFPRDDRTLIVVNDNNYPFSNGRSFSQGKTVGNGLRADDNEFITIGLGNSLHVDSRVLSPSRH